MKRLTAFLIAIILAAGLAAAAQTPPGDLQGLRERLERRFDIVPLTDDVALRPKRPDARIRLIEINRGAILINGNPVTGAELREQLGADAEAVLRLSYLSPEARKAFAAPPAVERETPSAPAVETERADQPAERVERRHRSRDRVRIFGDVTVAENEYVAGNVVAVMGSVRVDGEVSGEVVAVMGSVTLGPKAVVGSDVVSVGGRVHRPEGATIRGGVTEVAIGSPNVQVDFQPIFGWGNFDGIAWLAGTTFRFILLVLVSAIALVVARPTVEASAQRVSENPLQTTLVGFASELLLIPALGLTAVVLAISIIGIPLLLLLPFIGIVLILFAIAGFSGTAYAIGQGTRRRLGMAGAPPIVDLFLGVLVILLPVLMARLIAVAPWPGAPIALPLLVIGFAIEFAAWACGFGAVITNVVSRWRARRTTNGTVAPAVP